MGLPLGIDPSKPSHELYDEVDYKVFWSGWQQYKLDLAEHAVVRDMLPVSGRRLIDIGCGYGRLADCYLDRFQQVVMLDGSLALLREARQNTAGAAIYIAADLHHLPFRKATFDTVMMVRVFHHITDSKACLSEYHRILCGGGNFLFTYRNKMYLMNLLRWLLRPTKDRPFSLNPSGIGTTLISHHPTYIKQLLHQSGFSNLHYQGVGVFDRLANMMGSLGKYSPTGEHSASLFGLLKIAPWMFCRAVADGSAAQYEASSIDDLLACLLCGGSITRNNEGYTCETCGRFYPIVDGILDFRVY